jgi:hypothetical protein
MGLATGRVASTIKTLLFLAALLAFAGAILYPVAANSLSALFLLG